MDYFQIEKGIHQGVYCHLVYLSYMQNTSWKMMGWMKHKLKSRLPEEISTTSDMQMTPPLWQSQEELKSLLMNMKEESKKVGLKINIQKTKIMASRPITSWQIDGETIETVTNFVFWPPKSLPMVTAAIKLKDTYSLEGKLWPT